MKKVVNCSIRNPYLQWWKFIKDEQYSVRQNCTLLYLNYILNFTWSKLNLDKVRKTAFQLGHFYLSCLLLLLLVSTIRTSILWKHNRREITFWVLSSCRVSTKKIPFSWNYQSIHQFSYWKFFVLFLFSSLHFLSFF